MIAPFNITTLLGQENKEKHIKGDSDLSELTKAIDLISGKSDDYERERQEKDKIIKELKSEVSDLSTSVKNLENQLDRQEQHSRRNCTLIHGITETQDEKTDDISLRTINEHLEVELTGKELDRTYRFGNPKSGNKRPRPIIIKFALYNIRRKVFVNKKKFKQYWNFNYRKSDQAQDGILKKAKNEFGFNVWTVDGRICYYDELAKKLRYILTNFCGFLRYGKHKIESFFIFGFVWVIDMQLFFTCEYPLSFTGNAPLIFYFELTLCFEAGFKNSFLFVLFFLVTTFLL